MKGFFKVIKKELVSKFQLLHLSRSCLLHQIAGPTTFESLAAFSIVLRVSSSFATKWLPTSSGLLQINALPQPVRTAVEKWNSNSGNESPVYSIVVCGPCQYHKYVKNTITIK